MPVTGQFHILTAVENGFSNAIRPLGYIQSERSTEVIKSLYASEKTRDSAALALIYKPYRKAARKEYLDILSHRQYVAEIAKACVEFRWKEAIPLLQEICKKPSSYGLFHVAFRAKRQLQGQPVPKEIEEAERTLKRSNNTPSGLDAIQRAKESILDSHDREAAAVTAICLALYSPKGPKWQIDTANRIGREILQELPAEITGNLPESLRLTLKEKQRRQTGPIERQPTRHKMSLPGSQISIKQAVAEPQIVIAAVCEATDEANIIVKETGVCLANQNFKIVEFLTEGYPQTGQVTIHYTYYDIPDVRERAVRKGERIIWLMDKRKGLQYPEYIDYVARKALADTAENRRSVQQSADEFNRKLRKLRPSDKTKVFGQKLQLDDNLHDEAIDAIFREAGLSSTGNIYFSGKFVISKKIHGFCEDYDEIYEYRTSHLFTCLLNVVWYNPKTKQAHVLY